LATVVFYEKPGCGTNARQKRTLEAAGHTVIVKNLLTEPWTAARLRGFFGDAPVSAWFNPAAPRMKSGEIDPAAVTASDALALMLSDPLPIRRPLIEAADQRCAGFESKLIASLLSSSSGAQPGPDLQGCSRPADSAPCPAPDDMRARQ